MDHFVEGVNMLLEGRRTTSYCKNSRRALRQLDLGAADALTLEHKLCDQGTVQIIVISTSISFYVREPASGVILMLMVREHKGNREHVSYSAHLDDLVLCDVTPVR